VRVVCVKTPSRVYWTSLRTLFSGTAYWLDMGHGLQRFLRVSVWQTASSIDAVVKATNQVTKGVAA